MLSEADSDECGIVRQDELGGGSIFHANHQEQGLPLNLVDSVRNSDVTIAAGPGGCAEDLELIQRR